MLKLTALLLIILFTLNGCVIHRSPEEKIEFSHSTKIKDLIGTYKNTGDPSLYLSYIIWGQTRLKSNTNNYIQHKDIELIEVSSNDNTLVVKAIKEDCVVYKKHYLPGRDFNINNGEIILSKGSHLLSRGAGDLILGPSYEYRVIGLDVEGNGMYKSQEYIAGLLFTVIPIAGAANEEIRFKKLDNTLTYADCTNR